MRKDIPSGNNNSTTLPRKKRDVIHPIAKLLVVFLLVLLLVGVPLLSPKIVVVSAKDVGTSSTSFPSALISRRGGSSSRSAVTVSTRMRSIISNSLSCSPTLHYYGRHKPPRSSEKMDMSPPSIVTREGKEDDNILDQKKPQTDETSSKDDSIDLKEFDQIAKDVEKWAEDLLSQNDVKNVPKKYHGSDEGGYWYELKCRKPHKFNANGETKLFLNWMKDSRGEKYARKQQQQQHEDHYHHGEGGKKYGKRVKMGQESDDDSGAAIAATISTKLHPCMKVISTINAPFEDVCLYLSQPKHYRDYNTLLVNVRDIQDLSHDSKLCWGQTPKLCKFSHAHGFMHPAKPFATLIALHTNSL